MSSWYLLWIGLCLKCVQCKEVCLKDASIVTKKLGINPRHDNTSCQMKLCQKTIRLTFEDFPPYSVFNSTTNANRSGLMQEIIRDMLSSCCHSCVNYNNHKIILGEFNLTRFAQHRDGDIFFPVFGSSSDTKVHGMNFLPFVSVPSMMLIYKKDRSPKAITTKLITSCFEIWPLVIMSLMLALMAGVIVWLLDTWFNADEFPRPFFQGTMEGFWWAYVSMTTVGYGDRAPKSFLARVFSVIWILVGITIVSIVTASLTTSISTAATDVAPTLSGKKLAIIGGRIFERQEAVKQNAVIDSYIDILSARKALEDEKVTGIFVDNFVGMFYLARYFKNDENIHSETYKTKRSDPAYGFLIPDDDLFEFCKSFINYNREFLELGIMLTLAGETAETKTTSIASLFSPSSGFFSFGIMIAGIILLLFMVLGIAFEFWRIKKERARASLVGDETVGQTNSIGIQLNSYQNDPCKSSLLIMENSMHTDVREMIRKWEDLIMKHRAREKDRFS